MTWGLLGDFDRFVCTDSGKLSNVISLSLLHTTMSSIGIKTITM